MAFYDERTSYYKLKESLSKVKTYDELDLIRKRILENLSLLNENELKYLVNEYYKQGGKYSFKEELKRKSKQFGYLVENKLFKTKESAIDYAKKYGFDSVKESIINNPDGDDLEEYKDKIVWTNESCDDIFKEEYEEDDNVEDDYILVEVSNIIPYLSREDINYDELSELDVNEDEYLEDAINQVKSYIEQTLGETFTLEIPLYLNKDKAALEEYIADFISDETGYLVDTFEYNYVDKNISESNNINDYKELDKINEEWDDNIDEEDYEDYDEEEQNWGYDLSIDGTAISSNEGYESELDALCDAVSNIENYQWDTDYKGDKSFNQFLIEITLDGGVETEYYYKEAKEYIDNILGFDESLKEDTIKQNGKWTNKGKEGTHGTFKTKKEADAQRKAMFANGYREDLNESNFNDFFKNADSLENTIQQMTCDVWSTYDSIPRNTIYDLISNISEILHKNIVKNTVDYYSVRDIVINSIVDDTYEDFLDTLNLDYLNLKESCKENLKENYSKGKEVFDAIVERVKDNLDDKYNNFDSTEDAIYSAIDDYLIYTEDIFDLAQYYGVDTGEIIDKFYDELYNDIYSIVIDKFHDEAEDEEYNESLKEEWVKHYRKYDYYPKEDEDKFIILKTDNGKTVDKIEIDATSYDEAREYIKNNLLKKNKSLNKGESK